MNVGGGEDETLEIYIPKVPKENESNAYSSISQHSGSSENKQGP